MMKIEIIKQANSIYSDLTEYPTAEAIKRVDMLNLNPEVKDLVIKLINNAEQSSQVFENIIVSTVEQEASFQSIWQIGDTIGPYVLNKHIGSGGMSQVYAASRAQTDIQKPVAIKIFTPFKNSAILQQKFLAEQKILSDLSHPNIVTMQYGDTCESGHPYLVMELISDAQSISKYAQNKQLSTQQKMRLIVKVALAVEYAHNNLIIHRDLKPSNILVDHQGQLKVVDFGIAKLIEDDGLVEVNQTIAAMTPGFAAPEQILGQAITVKSDVFSLAAVALNLLTEQQPFPEDRLIKACQTDDQHVQQALKSANINQDLKNILNQALQQDPHRRYANMHAFAEDLQAWLEQRPVTATGDSLAYRLQKFALRRQALFSSLVVMLAAVLIGLGVFSWQFKQTRLETQKAQAVKNFMLDAFSVTDPNVTEGVDITAKDLLTVAADNLADNKKIDPEIKFELYQSLGLAYSRLGFLPRAIDLIKQSLSIKPNDSSSLAYLSQFLFKAEQQQELSELLAQIDESTFTSDNDKARLWRVQANRLAERGAFEDALAKVKHLNQLNVTNQEKLFNHMLEAEVYYLKGESSRSIEIIKNAMAQADLKPTNTLMLGMQMDLVHYYDRVGDYESALELITQVIENYRTVLGNRHPDLGIALNELTAFQYLSGKLEEAQMTGHESKDLFFKLYGANSPGLSQAYSNLGMIAYLDHDIDTAIDHFTRAAEILRVVYSDDHPETLAAEYNLATILNRVGKSMEARTLLEHIYQVELATQGPHNRNTLMTQQSLILSQAASGDLALALQNAEDNLRYAKAHFDHQLPVVIGSQFVLANIYLQSERHQAALDLYLSLEENWPAGDEVRYYQLTENIAKTYAGLRNHPQAEIYWIKSIDGLRQIFTDQHINSIKPELSYVKHLKSIGNSVEATSRLESIKARIMSANIDDLELLDQMDDLTIE